MTSSRSEHGIRKPFAAMRCSTGRRPARKAGSAPGNRGGDSPSRESTNLFAQEESTPVGESPAGEKTWPALRGSYARIEKLFILRCPLFHYRAMGIVSTYVGRGYLCAYPDKSFTFNSLNEELP